MYVEGRLASDLYVERAEEVRRYSATTTPKVAFVDSGIAASIIGAGARSLQRPGGGKRVAVAPRIGGTGCLACLLERVQVQGHTRFRVDRPRSAPSTTVPV